MVRLAPIPCCRVGHQGRITSAKPLGGSKPLPELFAAAGLRFDFGPATVQSLMDAVGAELDRLPD